MLISLVLLVIPPLAPQNGLWWDFLMALGYLATGLLFLLPLVTTRFWYLVGGNAAETRSIIQAHRIVTYLAMVFLSIHIGGLLILDSLIIEYLKPSAPWGMVAALLATIAFCVAIAQSEFRIKLNMRYGSWRHWHMVLSAVAVVGTFYHIFEAKYFVQSMSEIFTLAVVSVAVGGIIFVGKRRYQPASAAPTTARPTGAVILRFTLYASLAASLLVFIFSIPDAGNRAERQALHCLIENC